MEEKKYLKWYNKIGYGSGDIAGDAVYALLSSFVMIYLTDTVGLNSGVVGILIAISKLFDGFSDVFFGIMIDKTKSKMGKARPWMFYGYFGCAVCLTAIFCIPESLQPVSQYIWFFITYTLLNAGFYAANNIAYAALTALVTKNNQERVQMGSIRFIFGFSTSLIIQTITVGFVAKLGGGAPAWRTVAIVYSIVGLIANTISVFSVREIALDESEKAESNEKKESFVESFKLLIHNEYFLWICLTYLLMQIYAATLNMGIYFMKYVLKDEMLFGVFAWAINIPMIIGLMVTPLLVKRFNGMYHLNICGYLIGVFGRIGVLIGAYMTNIPIMLIFTAIAALGMSPIQGDMNALIATTSEYTRLKTGKRLDGMMFSCTTFGNKVGGGIGTAIAGGLLSASGYIRNATSQPASCLTMLHVIYLWMPVVLNVCITLVLIKLDIEKVNKKIQNEL